MTLNRVKLSRFDRDIKEAIDEGQSEDEALNIAIAISKLKGYSDDQIRDAVEHYHHPEPPASIPPALALKNIIQFEIPPIFRRQHLNRDVVIMGVGDRGGGKSVACVGIGVIDYALQGDPLWSNMDIKATFKISDEIAAKYGLAGGEVTFESQPFDMAKFMAGDSDYRDGCIDIEEINIAMADARRSMSNDNLASSDIVQLIRKYHDALVGNCIHEMFIDTRIRDAVDIFIRCEDKALFPEGLDRKMPQGLEFAWQIFPMTRKLTGIRYGDGQEPIRANFMGRQWWGSYDTDRIQKRRKYLPSSPHALSPEFTAGEPKAIAEFQAKWGWLENRIMNLAPELMQKGYPIVNGPDGQDLIKINSFKLWDLVGVTTSHLSDNSFSEALDRLGIVQLGRVNRRDGRGSWLGIPTSLEIESL